ncbi:hypothetical protein [Lactococcus lactis]|uniref:hypothetical protein n=1 Tax=Lactococcus lactis TaxID=1358 RepID=UPI00223BA28B|nr:hypothetical protein [Lactococcus lactis]MCT1172014.1 hypothetical protein [Lactococcus lactis]
MNSIFYNSLNLKILIAIVLSMVPVIIYFADKLFSKKYVNEKKINEKGIKTEEIESLIYEVLDSWNQEQKKNNIYTKNLIKIHSKYLLANHRKGEKIYYDSVLIEGMYNFRKKTSGFSIIVCYQLKYKVEFQKEWYQLNQRITDGSFDYMIRNNKSKQLNMRKIVQKWYFSYEEGILKVDKFI